MGAAAPMLGLVCAALLAPPAAVPRRPIDERQRDGIWISPAELMQLPTCGKAWETLYAAATSPRRQPNIADQNDRTDVETLAAALVAVRTGDAELAAGVRESVVAAIGTQRGGRTLALGRNLAAFVIAADLVGLDPQQDRRFRAWLREVLDERLEDKTLRTTHEIRPNNWGTMAGGSRAAVAAYLGDEAELEQTARVFKGWLGDRSAYAGFRFRYDLSWHLEEDRPRGVNPAGSRKRGHDIDGALPDDMRRGGSFAWPPGPTGYPWEALQGAVVQAEILHRAGYDAWEWSDRALLRAVEFLYRIEWKAEGDDEWTTWLIDSRYGTHFARNQKAKPGKLMGWTAWTHQPRPAGAGEETLPE